ncbi:MAG: primosomal protein N' [Thermodesulfobacteria bacterium]|nr:primosomal protein N' [Thermodesulfobacteriota bacterium]
MYLLEVVLPLPLFQTFYYLSEDYILEGIRVLVPFRNTKLIGIVKNCKKTDENEVKAFEFELKEVSEVIDSSPIIPPRIFPFLEWVAEYYLSPIGQVFKIALPPGTFSIPQRRIYLTPEGKEALKNGELPECFNVIKKRGYSVKRFTKKFGISLSKITKFAKQGLLKIEYSFPAVKEPKEKFIRLTSKGLEESDKLSEEAKKVLSYLKEKGEVPEKILKEFFSSYYIRKLLKVGYIERVEYPRLRKIFVSFPVPETYELTSEQKEVYQGISQKIDSGGFCPILLFGVTGSGKSFVYLELIKKVLKERKRVLILVPEIALTTYMEVLLLHQFKEGIALLHSGLSQGERLREWKKVLSGEAKIVVGTRSAIFAPIENLGLIIVDEEHDPSYKEENLACKYNARDLAVLRAKFEEVPVILGSATPSIKSYYLAKKGKYHLFTLKKRPYARLPEVKIIENKEGLYLTKALVNIIKGELKKGKSVFLYLNRRGYSPLVICEECGYVWTCPNCGIALVYHREFESLECHYCGFRISSKVVCPSCKGDRFKFRRAGTEKIEERIKLIFPEVKVVRLDRDSVSTESRLFEVLKEIYSEEPKIIVGTQMGVHGHNFPGVDVVGILRAEEGLFIQFYKSAERTFALLVQAAGRAGRRDIRGLVVLQTSIPDHYVIKYAIKQDYEGFYEKEIIFREKFRVPPFARIAIVKIEGVKEEKVVEICEKVTKLFLKTIEEKGLRGVDVLGPAPCPLVKLKGLYRWHILIKAQAHKEIKILIKELLNTKRVPGIKISFDIDPEELM